MLILFNKPFNVLSQFTDDAQRKTLADFIDLPGYYPAGRLDKDSEGLLILTNDGKVQHKIAHPAHKMPKTYWVQVENIPSDQSIDQLSKGVRLKDGLTKPAIVRHIPEPPVWPRTPPIRERRNIPTAWLEVTITEGRNRQVRRMTAAINHPTLRLIRAQVGQWTLDGIKPGDWVKIHTKNR